MHGTAPCGRPSESSDIMVKENDKIQTFVNVKDQIGFCGLWCGSCIVGNGTLHKLTEEYKKLISAYGLRQWAPDDFNFDEFVKGLDSIQKLPLCSGCLKGGGRNPCEIRTCASNKGLRDCTSCKEFGRCANAEILEHMRPGARDAGMSVKTQNIDRGEFIKTETAELKAKWPCSILFMHD